MTQNDPTPDARRHRRTVNLGLFIAGTLMFITTLVFLLTGNVAWVIAAGGIAVVGFIVLKLLTRR